MIIKGTRVRYIHEDTEEDKALGFYPPIGTCGTVVWVREESKNIVVKWDSGTIGEGTWWCEIEYVEEVTE